jgi:hypothetical protein
MKEREVEEIFFVYELLRNFLKKAVAKVTMRHSFLKFDELWK